MQISTTMTREIEKEMDRDRERERERGGRRGRGKVRPCICTYRWRARGSLHTVGAFQSICKLSTLMAWQSHPVVTKHRGRHCLVCEEIVVPDRSNLSRLARVGRSAAFVGAGTLGTENKDHSALIAPSRSNRSSRRVAPSLSSPGVPRPVHFSPSFPFTFPSLQDDFVSSIDRDKPRENKIPRLPVGFAQITLSWAIHE